MDWVKFKKRKSMKNKIYIGGVSVRIGDRVLVFKICKIKTLGWLKLCLKKVKNKC